MTKYCDKCGVDGHTEKECTYQRYKYGSKVPLQCQQMKLRTKNGHIVIRSKSWISRNMFSHEDKNELKRIHRLLQDAKQRIKWFERKRKKIYKKYGVEE